MAHARSLVAVCKVLCKAGAVVRADASPVPAACSSSGAGVEWLDPRGGSGTKAGAARAVGYCPCHWAEWLKFSGPGISQDRAAGWTLQAEICATWDLPFPPPQGPCHFTKFQWSFSLLLFFFFPSSILLLSVRGHWTTLPKALR